MSSYLEQQMNLLKFDKRLLEINFKNGQVSQDEYKKHLETLEDDEDKAEKLGFQKDMEAQNEQESMDDGLSDSVKTGEAEEKREEGVDSSHSSPIDDPFGSGY